MHGNTKVYALNLEATGKHFQWMRYSEARRDDDCYIAQCALCDKPAKRIDHLFPYHQEFNRCKEHMCEARERSEG